MSSPMKRRFSIFLLLIVLTALFFIGKWFYVDRFLISTDNAYLQSEITRISSQLPARIEQVRVQDNQAVKQGDVLVELEADDFRVALERANASLATREAELLQARSKLQQQSSLIASRRADVSSSQATLNRVQIDLNRAQALRKPGYISEERITTLSADNQVAHSQLSKSEADLRVQQQQIAALEAEVARLEAMVRSAKSDVSQAELNLSRTQIRAPISGVIGQRAARQGQVVQNGSYLLSLVPDEDIWVQANFKETQIEKMHPGLKAELIFDSFPNTPIQAQVQSMFAASGAQFSLLPPDNATGNFTKVVQRIPVKLTFDADNPLRGKLRAGMSVLVHVDLRSAE